MTDALRKLVFKTYENETPVKKENPAEKTTGLNPLIFNTFNFEVPQNTAIIVVGTGGTGGYVVRDLARFAYSKAKSPIEPKKIDLILVDHDTVEERNLLRQNFVEADLGRNKAEVVAERYSAAFGIDIEYITNKLNAGNLYDLIFKDNLRRPKLIIGCVDNNETRRIIDKLIQDQKRNIANVLIGWLDSGNEKASGQVILGSISNYCTSYLPFVTNLYSEIRDSSKDTKEKISCAERAVQDVQNIFVNLTAANHILNFVNMIYSGKKTAIQGLEFATNGVTSPLYLKKVEKWLDAYNSGRIL